MSFSPYLTLAALLVMFGSFIAGNFHGHSAERKTWELTVARQARDANALLAQSEAAARAQEQAATALKDEIEKEHIDAEARIAAAHNANALLLAGGLRDARATCRADGLSANPQPAGGAAAAAAGGCVLSSETSRAVLDLAALADRTAAYAAACHAWVMQIGLKTASPEPSK